MVKLKYEHTVTSLKPSKYFINICILKYLFKLNFILLFIKQPKNIAMTILKDSFVILVKQY